MERCQSVPTQREQESAEPAPQHLEEGHSAVWGPEISLLTVPVCKNLFSLLIPLVSKLQE